MSANPSESRSGYLKGKSACVQTHVYTCGMKTLPHEPVVVPGPEPTEDQLAWLGLALSPGLGPRRILEAMRGVESPSDVFRISLTELEGLHMPASAAQFVFDGKARLAAKEEWARVVEQGATILTYGCADYPDRLKEIYDPPPVLWIRGVVSLLARPAIAIVGTRHPSPYGSGIAEMLARDLSVRRLLVVSGMARGIDTCAHKGALAARRPTVAVWARAST